MAKKHFIFEVIAYLFFIEKVYVIKQSFHKNYFLKYILQEPYLKLLPKAFPEIELPLPESTHWVPSMRWDKTINGIIAATLVATVLSLQIGTDKEAKDAG